MAIVCNFILIGAALLTFYFYGIYPQYQSQIDFEYIDLDKRDPMTLWENWFKEAKIVPENTMPQGMGFATVRQDRHPALRTLLMRGYDKRGFQIYTDYTSPKGHEIESENSVALLFTWSFIPKHGHKPIGTRQVRVEGIAEKLSRIENLKYFEQESIDSKIRAAVQHQSARITPKRHEEILEIARNLYNRVHNEPEFRIEMPEKWGGYVIRPKLMEFFQATPHALAERVRFQKRDNEDTDFENLPEGVYAGADDWVYEYLEF